jgi:hypothetical protein
VVACTVGPSLQQIGASKPGQLQLQHQQFASTTWQRMSSGYHAKPKTTIASKLGIEY